jgi:hypothetical protein
MQTSSGTLSARSHQGFRASGLSRVACSVAAAIGLSLSIGATPIDEPSKVAIDPKAYIRSLLPLNEALCLIKLYGKESAFDTKAVGNLQGRIQTYGIPQLKNPIIKDLSAYKQIDFGIKYVYHRYSDACEAWTHWKVKGWH